MTSDFSARARQYQDALYEVLAGEGTTVSDGEPLATLNGLLDRCLPLAREDPIAIQALDAVASFAERPGLDDGLVAFLQDLLEAPPPAPPILESLARTFPGITADNLEDAIVELHRLLQDELERNNGAAHLRREADDA